MRDNLPPDMFFGNHQNSAQWWQSQSPILVLIMVLVNNIEVRINVNTDNERIKKNVFIMEHTWYNTDDGKSGDQ